MRGGHGLETVAAAECRLQAVPSGLPDYWRNRPCGILCGSCPLGSGAVAESAGRTSKHIADCQIPMWSPFVPGGEAIEGRRWTARSGLDDHLCPLRRMPQRRGPARAAPSGSAPGRGAMRCAAPGSYLPRALPKEICHGE